MVQVWQRDDAGAFTRVHASNEPFHSTLLDAWIVPGRGMVQLWGGARPWRTLEEATTRSPRWRPQSLRRTSRCASSPS
ncbi:MAG: hypothetical protein IPJ34_31450 [Myxococcales bacterium]|nr:hypothetical protein [Myxococcales bacterium]